MKFTKSLTIGLFIFMSTFTTIAQADCYKNGYGDRITETDQQKAIRLTCESQVNNCKAQCEGLSNQADQVDKGLFSDSESSPRDRCRRACGETGRCCSL